MNKYYVEITKKSGKACVFSQTIEAPLAVCAKLRACEIAEISQEDRYLYDIYIKIVKIER